MDRRLDSERVERFPARSSGELLRAMPGLHLTSHGSPGGGVKPWVRGFDDAYGSDLLVTVEGVPLNEVSNIHGHGYLDLHLIPAGAVIHLDLSKGNDRAEWGNFAVVGSADYHLGLEDPGWTVNLSALTDLGASVLVAWRPEQASPATFVLAETERGVHWAPDRLWRQSRLAAGIGQDLGPGRLTAFLLAYDALWESPGALRQEDIASGQVDHYGSYGLNQGGTSRRFLAGSKWEMSRDYFRGNVGAYVGGRWLQLIQNWTGFYNDAEIGDGTGQGHQALTLGGRGEVHQLWELWGDYSVGSLGIELRADAFQQFGESIERDRTVVSIEDRVEGRQVDLSTWTSFRLGLAQVVKITPGLRVDWTWLQETDLLNDTGDSTSRQGELILQPKLSFAYRPVDELALFAAAGRSFRSMAVGQDSMKADAAEVGLRVSPTWFMDIQGAAFGILVSDDHVFDPATGREIRTGPTWRLGVEAAIDLAPTPWLDLQFDVSFTNARFVQDNAPVPYAPRGLGSVAVYVRELPLLGFRFNGGVRVWALGTRSLPSEFESRTTVMVDLLAQAERGKWTFGASIKNLLNTRWYDGEFVYQSWFDPNVARSDEPALHGTAGTPFTFLTTIERQL
jgi:hypothetical protein